jgi:diguanylate cyclase (GGDEF)-like protein
MALPISLSDQAVPSGTKLAADPFPFQPWGAGERSALHRQNRKPVRRRAVAKSRRVARVDRSGILDARNRILEKIALGCTISAIFAEIVEVGEELAPGIALAVHLVDPDRRDGGRLTAGVARSLPAEVTRSMERNAIGAPSTARSSVASRRLGTSLPAWASTWSEGHEELLRRHKVRLVRVFPAESGGGRVVATLSVFRRSGNGSGTVSDSVFKAMASLAAMGVARAGALDRLRDSAERLRRDLWRDELTGLPNRSTLMQHLRRLLERSRRAGRAAQFGVLFLDFDHFKRINDSLGHMAGDELLAAIARRLRECIRPGDTVARLGGDEFAILLDRVQEVTEATRVAERVHQVLREPFHIHGIEVLTTTSVGIALGSRAYERPEDVLRDADTAMYRAKAAGKARYEVFDAAMHARAVEQLELEADLRRALGRHEFRLLYHPVVALRDRSLRGLEVLTRWSHPTRGVLTPSTFLHAAEESGLIVEIGWWGFREACSQMTRWLSRYPSRAPLTVHVNLSDRQLFEPDLTGRIERGLAEAGIEASRLVLDVSENVIMQKAESAVTILTQLKSIGLQIHLDDFGTGYSSLGYLHRFEIDALKIDRSFIRHLRAGGDNWTAVRTIIGLAQNLAMEVIAEGVETEEQLDELLALGCQFGQGSLFHEPVSADGVEDLLG